MTAKRSLAVAACLLLASGSAADAQTRHDVLVQPPLLPEPERGAVAGALSRLAMGPGDLERGSFALPAPLAAPEARGALLWNLFPTYTPEGGQSEWGMGWEVALSIRRHRLLGGIDYQSDGFLSPWGRLQQGTDGHWYVRGQPGTVRLSWADDAWEAVAPDGTRYRFDVRVDTAAGTYAWYLRAAETVAGDRTELAYERNDSGRPFLAEATYGARGFADAYRVTFTYEPVAVPLTHYGAGAPLVLDRRVRQVETFARHAGTGAHARRWRDELTYRDSAFGPAFYLASVQRHYAAGASEPPVTYAYELPEEAEDGAVRFRPGTLAPAPALDAYREAVRDPNALYPDRVSMIDLDQDGLMDLESPAGPVPWTMYRQQPDGTLVAEPPPPEPPDVDRRCRPAAAPYNGPRTLARLRPDADEVQVLTWSVRTHATLLHICDRAGNLLAEQWSESDGTRWALGPNTRLADFDGDRRPDLVLASRGQYVVLENISGQGCGADEPGPCVPFGFVAHPWRPLPTAHRQPIRPDMSWVHDMNGDGYPDLVQRHGGGVSVWYGHGRFTLASSEVELRFVLHDGQAMRRLDEWELAWVDANRDGLMDALLTHGSAVLLFLNDGSALREARVRAFEELRRARRDIGVPVIADLRATGNTEVIYQIGGATHALPLNNPATGLLVRADDGKGTVVSFAYARAPATAGVPHRASVLAAMTVESSGYDPVRYAYDYAAPVAHSQGRMLVGFDEVRQEDAVVTQTVRFHHDDDITGVVLETLTTDARTPDLVHGARTDYEERRYEGVRWLRPRRDVIGYRSLDGPGEVAQTTDYEIYEREWCPTRVRTANVHGVLLRETLLAEVAALPADLHCLPAYERVGGLHANARRDFLLEQEITRNALGQVTAVIQHGDAGPRVQQTVTYDALHRVARVAQPGRGQTEVTYDPATGLVHAVRAPDGVVRRAREHDPVTDTLRAFVQDRGRGGVLTASFRFDALERLERHWRDFGGSSDAAPLAEVRYAFPTHGQPGHVRARTLLDAATGLYGEDVAFLAADGETIATAARIPEGWRLAGLVREDRTEREVTTYRRPPLGSAMELDAVTHALLGADAVRLTQRRSAGFGHTTEAWEAVQTDVERIVEETLTLDDLSVVATATENGTHITRSAADLDGNVLWHQDQSGAVTTYERDALGRLVQITLPDGQQHRVAYDPYGRPARIERTGIGTIAYDYDPHTGLVTAERVQGASGALARTVTYARDAIGRVTAETHTLAATGETQEFTYTYDGAIEPPVPGQRGHLTRVTGARHQATTRYHPDGTVAERTLRIDDWRAITWQTDYYAHGHPRQVRRTVRDLARGTVIDELVQGFHYDAWGRLARLTVNGAELATLVYDAEGRLDRVELAGGAILAYQYDATTHALRGTWQDSGLWVAGIEWDLDARGHIARETFAFGDAYTERAYTYEARGFLASARDPAQTATYAYSVAGLPTAITDELGTRALARTGSSLRAGDLEYRYDDLGRVVRKGDLQLTYGPDGHLAEARRGNRAWRYYHDEHGQRLFQEQDGRIVAAFVDGAYLTDSGVLTPVRLAGRLVGVLDGATFHLLATDPRGTVLADRDGTPRLPSPYGVRTTRPDLAAALDYVEKGFDADLGTVRMGVRDYDPFLGQFLTPDPLFLAELGRCVDSPVECNLYSYAANNPLRYLDPNGQNAWDWVQGALDAASIGLDATGVGAAVSWVPDVLNAGISLGRGDWKGAALSASAAVPILGAAANTTRIARAVKKGVDEAGDAARTAAKATDAGKTARGAPNPHGSRGGPAHRATVERRIEELQQQGHTHVGGGSRREEVIPTPGGFKTSRRPDITTRAPDGSIYRENVGRVTKSREPIARERKALDDLERATGKRPGYTPYDR